MQNKILNFITSLKRLCFSVCLFVCPLLFLTNTTQNPFAVQPLFFSIFGAIFVLCYVLELVFKSETNIRCSKLDFVLFAFLFSLLFSLTVNYFFGDYKTALVNDFLRKSDYLIFGLIFGFLSAKIISAKFSFDGSSYRFLKNIFLWCLAWFLWKLQAGTLLAVIIFGFGVYLCFLHLKDYSVRAVLDVLLAVCFCSCLYGLIQALGFDLFWVLDISKEFGARPVSTFGNPNFLASFALLFLPYSVFLFLKSKSKYEILISGFITLVLAVFLVISGTRSAWVGLFGSAFIFFALSGEVRKIFKVNLLKILILFCVSCFCTFGVISGLKYNGNSAPKARIAETKQFLNLNALSLQGKNFIQPLHQRLMMWHCALAGFRSSPLFGKGVNSYQLNFPFCQGKLISQNPALDKIKMQANAAHNEYLEILYEGGFFSLTLYVSLLGLFFILISKKIKVLEKEEKLFYLALLFGVVSVLIDNLFNITLRTFLVAFAFWFVFSLINNLITLNKKVKLNIPFCTAILILTVACTGFLIYFQSKIFTAQIYELNGYKNLVKGQYKNAADDIEKAIKISSMKPEPYYALINTYINLNNLKKAREISGEVLKFYPAYYEFYFRFAALHEAQKDLQNVLVNLRKTLLLLPVYTPAAELFANILRTQNNVSKEDKKMLESLIPLLPYEPNLPSYLAEIYVKENNCPQAGFYAKKALEGNIFDKPALEIFTVCHDVSDDEFLRYAIYLNGLKNKIRAGQNNRLFDELVKASKEYQNDRNIVSLLAEFYFRQGKFCEAEDEMKRAKGKNFWGKAYSFSLSLSAQKCGDSESAVQTLEEILYFDPYDELAKNRLKNVNI